MAVSWIAQRADRRGLRRLGKLKKGEPKEQAKGFPQNQSYFRLMTPYPDVAEAFEKVYGDEPQAVNVYLPYADLRQNFDYYLEKWTANEQLVFRCNGQDMVLWRDDENKVRDEPRPCPYCSGERPRTPQDPGDSLVGRLEVIVPELLEQGLVGTITVETGSTNDCSNIDAALMDAARTNGNSLQGIPFKLYRSEEEIWVRLPDGKRRKTKEWLVRIEPHAEWIEAHLRRAERVAFRKVASGRSVGADDATLAPADAPDTTAPASPMEEQGVEIEDTPRGREEASVSLDVALAGTTPLQTGPGTGEGDDRSRASRTTRVRKDEVSRPYRPEVVRKGVTSRAARNTASASRARRRTAARLIDDLFPEADDLAKERNRQALCEYLFDKTDWDDLTAGECYALIAWAGSRDKTGKLQVNSVAVEEADAILQEHERTKLQVELPF